MSHNFSIEIWTLIFKPSTAGHEHVLFSVNGILQLSVTSQDSAGDVVGQVSGWVVRDTASAAAGQFAYDEWALVSMTG
jgi:hypothetical protein